MRKLQILRKRSNKLHVNSILQKYLENFEEITVVDVGAHKGIFTSALKDNFKIKKAVLIEPIPENFQEIKNKFPENYEVFNNAVSDIDGQKVNFYINGFDETSSLLEIKNNISELDGVNVELKRVIQSETITLDKVFNLVGQPNIDLIKIDVQGAEENVVKGAINMLKSTKFVWVETSFKELYKDCTLFNDIYEIMYRNNFLLVEISPGYRNAISGELLQADLLFKNPNIKF